MEQLMVGQCYSKLKNNMEGMTVEVTPSGITCMVYLPEMTSDELSNISKGKISYKLSLIHSCGVMTVKFGSLNWMDAVVFFDFDRIPQLTFPMDNTGYAFTIFAADTISGKIKHIRMIGLDHEFSLRFNEMFVSQSQMSSQELSLCKVKIYNQYSTNQITKMAIASGNVKKKL